jgi:bisphosphoglycerate-dependent phosphoglycerate mutase
MNISHLILTEGNSLRILVIENITKLNENDIFELTRNLHYYNLLQNIRFRYNTITTVP